MTSASGSLQMANMHVTSGHRECSPPPFRKVHGKKRLLIFLSPAGMSLTKLTQQFNYSRPGRESLVSDIPAGDGKTANFFLLCRDQVGGRCQRQNLISEPEFVNVEGAQEYRFPPPPFPKVRTKSEVDVRKRILRYLSPKF